MIILFKVMRMMNPDRLMLLSICILTFSLSTSKKCKPHNSGNTP